MLKLMAATLLVLATSTALMADHGHKWWEWGWGSGDHDGEWGSGHRDPAPEIDPTTGIAAVALLAGGALIVRGRRKQ